MSRLRDLYENVERSEESRPWAKRRTRAARSETPLSRWAREVTDALEWATASETGVIERLLALVEEQNLLMQNLNARVIALEVKEASR